MDGRQYLCAADGTDLSERGTSCAAPLWADLRPGQPAGGHHRPAADWLHNPALGPLAPAAITRRFSTTSPPAATPGAAARQVSRGAGLRLVHGLGHARRPGFDQRPANPEPLIIRPANALLPSAAWRTLQRQSQYFSLTTWVECLDLDLVQSSAWLAASPTNGTLTPGGPSPACW